MNIADVLSKHGWLSTGKDTWKHPRRPDQEIRCEPAGWVHLKQSNMVEHDFVVVKKGNSARDLEAYLTALHRQAPREIVAEAAQDRQHKIRSI